MIQKSKLKSDLPNNSFCVTLRVRQSVFFTTNPWASCSKFYSSLSIVSCLEATDKEGDHRQHSRSKQWFSLTHALRINQQSCVMTQEPQGYTSADAALKNSLTTTQLLSYFQHLLTQYRIICLICKSRHSIVTLSTHCYFLKSNKTTLKSLISI